MAQAKRKVDDVFNALGDPTRRAIVHRLARGPLTVSDLAGPLSITLTGVRQHLHVLEVSGLVRTEKLGRARMCTFEPKGLGVIEAWINVQRSLWERGLGDLPDLLDEDD